MYWCLCNLKNYEYRLRVVEEIMEIILILVRLNLNELMIVINSVDLILNLL